MTDYVRKGGQTDTYHDLVERIQTAVRTRRSSKGKPTHDLEQYAELIQLAPIKLFAIDADATIVWLNDEYAEGFEESKSELLGMEFPTLVERGYYSEAAVTSYLDSVRTLLSSSNDQQRGTYEVEFRSAGGDRRVYDVHIRLLPLEDGEFAGTIHALRDVTQRNRYRTELERQNERLEEFASVVSHDLRNPLNVAQGQLELHAEDCPVDDADSLTQVRGSLERMDDLIEDLLSLARHGRTVGETAPVDLSRLVHEAWGVVDTGGATLECTTEIAIDADGGRVRGLFENLFRNAIEHGGEDVTVTVGRIPDDGDGDTTGFFVADDGSGLPGTEDIFEFGHTTADEGTGFGLGIVAEIADAHGWQVSARASEDGGARFEIRDVTTSGPEQSAD